MIYDKIIEGKFVTLRSITGDDAEFSYNLRRDPRFIELMGQSAPSLEAQREYIKNQREKEGDYYFVVENKAGERIGLIGVYDIQGDRCEIGREINIGEPYETMEAKILLMEFCVTELKLKTCVGITYKNNLRQIHLQKKLGFSPENEIIRSGIPAYEYITDFTMLLEKYEKTKKMIDKIAKTQTYSL